MRIRYLALPMFMLLHASITQAQDTANAYDGIPEAVIESVGKKDIKAMFRAMSKYDEKLNESNPMLDGFAIQLQEQFKDTGDFLDASLYREEQFGTRYSVLNYVLNYAQKPMGLKVQMYNGKNGWRAINVNFSPDIDKFVSELRGVPQKK
ncbi:hypothetical protein BZK31_15025 [Pseudomonas floridensis]|uniref:DUF3887 domain-containing protein n=1 Tax=Pseudomonas floridensis TaxID=1958950 RepID=A0A1X0N4L4_9PSED|nr:hypothetical protein [Pseudomonas floridensis]ORC58457.1 hypothetical protein BZK31_15025 [Pseudomonas floridensis]